MVIEKYYKEKKTFVFELDNVIYPEKDYFLQVYYLFAQFIAYGEQLNETAVLEYMQQEYLNEGQENIFEKTASTFHIPEKYKVNFDMLLLSVRLPLKLLLFDEVLKLLQSIVLDRKQIYLLVSNNPAVQLNKIKQMEWNGLEKYLTVYFTEEFEANALDEVIARHQLSKDDVLLIGKTDFAVKSALQAGVDFLKVDELFVN